MKWTYKKEELIRYDSTTGKQIIDTNHWVIDDKGSSVALMATNQGGYRSEVTEQLREEHAKLIALTPELIDYVLALSSHDEVLSLIPLRDKAKALIVKLK